MKPTGDVKTVMELRHRVKREFTAIDLHTSSHRRLPSVHGTPGTLLHDWYHCTNHLQQPLRALLQVHAKPVAWLHAGRTDRGTFQ
jgi:hypothetical protein